MLIGVVILQLMLATQSSSQEVLDVICPNFEGNNSSRNTPTPFYLPIYQSLESNNEYCRCQLFLSGGGRTVVIKCDFNYEKDIRLTKDLFPFEKYNSSSAYVRMTNCKSANITSGFLSEWMKAPSSAVDIWSCGKLSIESAEEPKTSSKLPTFIGTGIINCTMDEFPSYFLRDRTRGALRFKGCNIGTIKTGIFHNVSEMRYLVIEDSVVDTIEAPLSTSGVIQLSRKSMHSWDGLEIINSTIQYIAPFAFSIAHKSDIENLVLKNSKFGHLGTGAFNASGDINVQIKGNSFQNMDSLAFKISVSGSLSFSDNNITKFKQDSLKGLNCMNKYAMADNIIYVDLKPLESAQSPFASSCGEPQVEYLVRDKETHHHVAVSAIVLSLLIICGLIFAIVYLLRTKTFILYKLKRHDTRLCEDAQETGDPEPTK